MSSVSALDSSLEALAFGYLSYGFVTAAVNNIWAWVAVVAAAAVSLWRIKRDSGSGSGSSQSPRGGGGGQRRRAAPLLTVPSLPPEMAADEPGDDEVARASVTTTSSRCVVEGEGSSKVKFSVYYDQEGFVGGSDDDGGEGDDDGVAAEVSSFRRLRLMRWKCYEDHDWERNGTVVRYMGSDGMGWYSCQDMTVLDGSVVRLWNGRRSRRKATVSMVDGVMAS